jgi:hypothetical protein
MEATKAMQRAIPAATIVALLALFPVLGHADELDPVAPLVNDHTVAVIRIDLNDIDLAALQKQYLDPLAQTDAARLGVSVAVAQAQDWLQWFRTNGVRSAYLIATMENLSQVPGFGAPEQIAVACMPIVVLPELNAAGIAELQKKLEPLNRELRQFSKVEPQLKCGEIRGKPIVAFSGLFDAMASAKVQPRPEFAAALQAAGDRPLRAAIVPPPFFARAAREILLDPFPGTKEPLGTIVSRGVKWASVGFEPNIDRFHAQLVIQSADAAAATEFADIVNRAIVMAGSKLAEQGQLQGLVGGALLTTLVPKAENDRLVLTLDHQRAAGLHQFAAAVLQASRASAQRHSTQNNLKQIGLALQNYEDKNRRQPDRAIRDKDGKPLLSWRVAILPEIEGGALYKEFHLDEPWDSEHNRKLIEKMPDPYRSPDSWQLHPGRTRYLAAVGENLAFPLNGPISLRDFKDGTSKTIQVVEADRDHAVIWTKPDDLEVDLENPLRGLATPKQMFSAVFGDGHVSTMSGEIDAIKLRALFTRNGGEPAD